MSNKQTCTQTEKNRSLLFFLTSTRHESQLSAPWLCMSLWGRMCGNACVCGSGRTAAIVKVIPSPRPIVTNGEQTGQFTYSTVGWAKSITQTTPALLCQPVYPNPPPVLMAFIHICSRIFGIRCEKKQHQDRMHTLSHINLSPAKSEGPDYFHLF